MRNTQNNKKKPDTGQSKAKNEISNPENPHPNVHLDSLGSVQRKNEDFKENGKSTNNTNNHVAKSNEENSLNQSNYNDETVLWDNTSSSERQIIDSVNNLLQESEMEVEEQDSLEGFKGVSIEMEFKLDHEDLANASIIAYTIELI